MPLLSDLEEFVADHRPHGTMAGDATPLSWNGYRLTAACPSGVVFERWVHQKRRMPICFVSRL
jgi:hypothetical protein